MSQPIDISIIIPVKNGDTTIDKCIDGWLSQTLFYKTEIIVIDSGSSDDTLSKLESRPVKIVEIPPNEFNHAATRNLGVSHAKGDFILFTVQDAWTKDNQLLERMHSHFVDPEVVGVCGQQVVPHEKGMNPHGWFRPLSEAGFRSVQIAEGAFDKLSPLEKYDACSWDNVISMYRKKALEAIPFQKSDFAEDLMWAKDALQRGYKLVYDQRNKVFHYHHAVSDFVFKRTFIELYSIYNIFGYQKKLNVPALLYLKIVYRNIKWNIHPKWILFNMRAKMARHRAYKTFATALQGGEDVLRQKYLRICGQIPQGRSYND